jgi:hypothetical protein
MSNQINDGGPAFPSPPSQHSNGFYSTGNGMTLRDYFAAAALQGFMAAHTSGGCLVDDLYAKYAYDLADAMLKQRDLK